MSDAFARPDHDCLLQVQKDAAYLVPLLQTADHAFDELIQAAHCDPIDHHDYDQSASLDLPSLPVVEDCLGCLALDFLVDDSAADFHWVESEHEVVRTYVALDQGPVDRAACSPVVDGPVDYVEPQRDLQVQKRNAEQETDVAGDACNQLRAHCVVKNHHGTPLRSVHLGQAAYRACPHEQYQPRCEVGHSDVHQELDSIEAAVGWRGIVADCYVSFLCHSSSAEHQTHWQLTCHRYSYRVSSMSWQRRESHLAQFHHHDCYPKRLAIYPVPVGPVPGYRVAGDLEQLRQLPHSTAVDLEVATGLDLTRPSPQMNLAVQAAKHLVLQGHQLQPEHEARVEEEVVAVQAAEVDISPLDSVPDSTDFEDPTEPNTLALPRIATTCSSNAEKTAQMGFAEVGQSHIQPLRQHQLPASLITNTFSSIHLPFRTR